METKIHCKYDDLVNPNSLKSHPKNHNHHGQDQIDRLVKIYEYQGVRHPILVSKQSGCIVAGHGRKLAAIRAGIKEMPIVYQNFESDEQEYAFIQSDNAIALWAELDLAAINADLGDLGPDFDLDVLGIKDFTLDFEEKLNYQDVTNGLMEKTREQTGAKKIILTFEDDEYEIFLKKTKTSFKKHNVENFKDLFLILLND